MMNLLAVSSWTLWSIVLDRSLMDFSGNNSKWFLSGKRLFDALVSNLKWTLSELPASLQSLKSVSVHCRCLGTLLISLKATLLDRYLEDSYTGVVNCINVLLILIASVSYWNWISFSYISWISQHEWCLAILPPPVDYCFCKALRNVFFPCGTCNILFHMPDTVFGWWEEPQLWHLPPWLPDLGWLWQWYVVMFGFRLLMAMFLLLVEAMHFSLIKFSNILQKLLWKVFHLNSRLKSFG